MSDIRQDKVLWGKAFTRNAAYHCRYGDSCWLKHDIPCPFPDTFCCDVTPGDWAQVMTHVFKEYPS